MKAKYHHQKQMSANGRTFSVFKIFLCLLLVFLVVFLAALTLSYEQQRSQIRSESTEKTDLLSHSSAQIIASTTIPSAFVVTATEKSKPVPIKSSKTDKLRGKRIVDEKKVSKGSSMTVTNKNDDSYCVNMTVSSAGELGTVILKVHNSWAPLGARR